MRDKLAAKKIPVSLKSRLRLSAISFSLVSSVSRSKRAFRTFTYDPPPMKPTQTPSGQVTYSDSQNMVFALMKKKTKLKSCNSDSTQILLGLIFINLNELREIKTPI